MQIMLIGGGGREHAIASALAKNPRVSRLYALPGNGGIAETVQCVPIGATDLDGIVAFAAAHAIDFAVVAPDDPLVLGAVDRLRSVGIRCFGPDSKAAAIEGSKAFAKALMQKYNIPTARFSVFEKESDAAAYVRAHGFPLVIKADGLALGKGVVIARTQAQALRALHEMMAEGRFGDSGRRVVIEEFLTGPEVTVLAFTDGNTIFPMVSAMDHKRALDGDLGPNTGGMGVVAPNPYYTPEIARQCMDSIFRPTIRAMRAEGRPFQGCLYFGLMLTPGGPRVIEYNCRFGDPEAQAVLSLLETDLLEIFEAVEAGRLDTVDIRFSDDAACCVMLTSGGYPGEYEKGRPIEIGALPDGVSLRHSGTACRDGRLVTAGGRVLGVLARAGSLPEAVALAYEAVPAIRFDGMSLRTDIGKRALEVI